MVQLQWPLLLLFGALVSVGYIRFGGQKSDTRAATAVAPKTLGTNAEKNMTQGTRFIFFLLFLLHKQSCYTQITHDSLNLVANSSFEERGRFFSFRTLEDVKSWYGPGTGSSDYFWNDTKRRPMAHTGKGFVAIGTFTYSDYQIINQEYISTKLTNRLIKGQKYCVSAYVMRSGDKDCSYSHNKFEYAFTKRKITRFNKKVIILNAYSDLENGDTLLNSRNWIQICGVYIANNTEKHITIGKFDPQLRLNPILDKKGKKQGATVSAYYYFDDVSVLPIKDERDCDCKNKRTSKKFEQDTSRSTPSSMIAVITVLENIFFTNAKSELLPQSFEELDKIVNYLFNDSETTIEISGHTDNRGNAEHNFKLSEARAKAVADYLTSKGIDKWRIKYSGYGSLRSIATNDTEVGREQNRRVEFIINRK